MNQPLNPSRRLHMPLSNGAKSRVLIHGTEVHDMAAVAEAVCAIGRVPVIEPQTNKIAARLADESDMALVVVEHCAVAASDIVIRLRRWQVEAHIFALLLGRHVFKADRDVLRDAGADHCSVLPAADWISPELLRSGLPAPTLDVATPNRAQDVLLALAARAVLIERGQGRAVAAA